jgi:hypothetical protein
MAKVGRNHNEHTRKTPYIVRHYIVLHASLATKACLPVGLANMELYLRLTLPLDLK